MTRKTLSTSTLLLLLAIALGALVPATVVAEVRVPALIGSHMVLQQDQPTRVWGWASPGEAVTVVLQDGIRVEPRADGLRPFTVTHATSLEPKDDVEGTWGRCGPDTAPSFSAVAFHFGQALHAELDVPRPVAVRYAWADNPEATLTNGAGLPASPFRTDTITAPKEMADGRALVRAMYDRYDESWYRDFMLAQDVTYFEDGRAGRTERMAEYIALPGRVRAITGDISEGNAEIYVDGAFHRFEAGEMKGRLPTVHGVLLLGFDVYAQPPEVSIEQLEALGVDLDRITEAEWRGRSGWVVGADPGDSSTPQFWVEKERLLCWRVVSQRPYGTLDVEMAGWEPLDGGWIATELTFRRAGELALKESYVEYRTLDEIDPALFDVEELKTTVPLP